MSGEAHVWAVGTRYIYICFSFFRESLCLCVFVQLYTRWLRAVGRSI